MSHDKPPIIQSPPEWQFPDSSGTGSEFPRRSGAAVGAVVLAICAIVVAAISAVPMFIEAPPAILFLGPLAALLAVSALICGIIGVVATGKKSGRLGRGTAIAGTILGVLASVGGGFTSRELVLSHVEARNRVVASNDLKQMSLGMHNHHDTFRGFPPAGDANLKSEKDQYGVSLGLSWRVRILPFIEQASLYEKLKMDEPWNSRHNAQYLDGVNIMTFQSPNYDGDPHNTVYLGVVDADADKYSSTGMDRRRGVRFRDITDGTAFTIVIVEADANQAVPWPKPADLQYDPEQPRRGLGTLRKNGFLAAFADGSVRFIPNDVDDHVLRCLLEKHDGKVVPLPE